MKKLIAIILLFSLNCPVFAETPPSTGVFIEDKEEEIFFPPLNLDEPEDESEIEKDRYLLGTIEKTKDKSEEQGLGDKVWDAIKGEPANNSLLLGMFSKHLSDKSHNETHNLLAIDYNGYSVGTFKNSFYKRTFYVGITRKLYEYSIKGYTLDIKYKAFLMSGYKEKYPDLMGITPVIFPVLGISKGYVGFDLMAFPAKKPTFVVNFRVNLPEFNKKSKDKDEEPEEDI